MTPKTLLDTVEKLRVAIQSVPYLWDGYTCVKEMKNAEYAHWKQTEWQGFYFQFLCERHFAGLLEMPGKRYGNTVFDAFCRITWDFKTHANSRGRKQEIITNDLEAVTHTLREYGYYGIILAVGEAELNGEDGEFRKRHDELKGGPSRYTQDRIERGVPSRRRKKAFALSEIHFICLDEASLNQCSTIFKQGRNADGSRRRPKINLTINKIPAVAFFATEIFEG